LVEISLKMEGTRAVLDCGPIALEPANIEERVRQMLPMLQRLIDADIAEISLSEPTLEKRSRGIAAQSMMVQAALASAAAQAGLLAEIVSGRESIADHGFPEFGDE